MRILVTLIFLQIIFAIPALSSQIVIPNDPSPKNIPKRNYLGEKIKGIRLAATVVFRLTDGEIIVMKGFLAGKPNGDSNFFYWNDKLAADCYGKTTLQKDKSGAGTFICSRDGELFLEGKYRVVPEKYMKFKSTTSAEFLDENGKSIWVILRWHAKTRFPDHKPLLEAFN